jgi:MFS transporter, MHS family, alpha-ketoglutarate permease
MMDAMSQVAVGTDSLRLNDVSRRLKAIFVGSIGNLVEWYDFYAYTAFALYFANSFFPGNDPVLQQLNAAVLFAIGFVMRPIGGWLFGHLADHHGRRNALMLSVLLMCFGSLVIAVTPTYVSIGAAAPVLLGLARIVQGLSLGGEYGASATYLTEVADEKHRGFYVSFHYVTLIGGPLCATLVLLILQQVFLTAEQMRAWGWRIPFVIGAMLAVIALKMRSSLHETDAFIEAKSPQRRESSIRTLVKYPRQVLIVIGLTAGGTTAFYTYTTYMQKFLKLSVGLSDNQTTMVSAGSLIFALCLQPIYGALSDRIGRKPLLIWFGLTGAVFTIPLLRSLQSAKSAGGAFVLIAGLHVDKCAGESRAVPNQSSSHRSRSAVCHHDFDIRWAGRVHRIVVQVDRSRSVVLLLPLVRDRYFAHRLDHDA